MLYKDPVERRAFEKDYMPIWTARRRIAMNILKMLTGCSRCGYNEKGEALDWHHVDPDGKLSNLAALVRHSEARVKAELEKCVLLCANCHRTETS